MMYDYTHKSVPLLVSKLTSAIAASQRGRDMMSILDRRERLKDELVLRGLEAIEPMLDLMRARSDEACDHAADVIGRIGSDEAIVPLAKILAGTYPQPTKRSAAKALMTINTPDAVLAVNIWQGRVDKVRLLVQAFVQQNQGDDALLRRLGTLAQKHRATPQRIADAYLLATTPETLSLDALARYNALRLSPQECAYIEEIQP